MNFPVPDKYILLGGGRLLLSSAMAVRNLGAKVLVVTSPRHAFEVVTEEGAGLEAALAQAGIDYVIAEKVTSDDRVTGAIGARTLALSFGAAWIFSKEFIFRFEGRLLNLHGARLPLDRGAGGFSWQILCGNRLGCCLIHQVDPGVDTGPILKYREFSYPHGCRIPADFQQVYIERNEEFLREFFAEVQAGVEFRVIEQVDYLSTYWPRLSTAHHGFIDWGWGLQAIERFVCAFDDPYQGASTYWNGQRVFLKKVFSDQSGGTFHPFQQGMVFRKSGDLLFIAAGEGALVASAVLAEDGKDLRPKVQLGDRFYTPREYLEAARQFRAVYTPSGLKS